MVIPILTVKNLNSLITSFWWSFRKGELARQVRILNNIKKIIILKRRQYLLLRTTDIPIIWHNFLTAIYT